SRAQAFAGAGWVKTSKSAVGMPARFINAFAKDLLDSMRPAPRSGPNTLKPAWRRASPTPASTAASGPSTMRPSRSRLAKSTILTTSAAPIGILRAMPPVPPLPGAQKTRSTSSDCTHFHTSACSRAPEPTTRTFMRRVEISRADSDRIRSRPARLLPFDGAGRLGRDVEDHAVDALHLVDDAVAHAREYFVRHARPVRCHRVLARHHANSHHVRVRPVVAHHAHGLQRREHGERLPDLPVQAEVLDLVDHHPVGVTQNLEPLGRHLA